MCAECGLEDPEISEDEETKRTWKQVGSSVMFANDGFSQMPWNDQCTEIAYIRESLILLGTTI